MTAWAPPYSRTGGVLHLAVEGSTRSACDRVDILFGQAACTYLPERVTCPSCREQMQEASA